MARAIARWGMPLLAIAALLAGAVSPSAAAAQSGNTSSAEQQLIEKYAPIMELKGHKSLCDSSGEQYIPAPVDIVFGDQKVRLRQAEPGGSSKTDPVLVTGPDAQDLYRLDHTHYLDLPGNPRSPGCGYARWNQTRMEAYEPTIYAHVKSNGLNQLAVQYWFFYAFNDFNNKHESDWEMMQLVWDVPTAEAALTVDPVSMAMAQHGGGETADWDDDKVQKDGNHPIVFPSSGSHASQYGHAIYLGWGENGTGFGCDTATERSVQVRPTPVLLPDTVPAEDGEFAWLMFRGRWGERQGGQYDGPTGPRMKTQWNSPFTWQEGLRESSLIVPQSTTFGPAPTEVFCSLSSYGSSLFTKLGTNLPLLGSIAGTIVVVVFLLMYFARRILWASLRIYLRHWRTFAVIGALLIPIGIIFNGFQYLITTYPPGRDFFKLLDEGPDRGSLTAAFLEGILQHLAGFIIVAPAVITAFARFETGEKVTVRGVYMAAVKCLPAIAWALLMALVVIVPLTIVLIGLPLAAWLALRWVFMPQAVVLDEQRGRQALARSARTIGKGKSWLRAATIGLLLWVIGAAPGPLTGLFLLIVESKSVDFSNTVSSLVYAVFLPFSILGYTILYRDLQARGAKADAAPAGAPGGETALATAGAA